MRSIHERPFPPEDRGDAVNYAHRCVCRAGCGFRRTSAGCRSNPVAIRRNGKDAGPWQRPPKPS
jgi:hypothetical protein